MKTKVSRFSRCIHGETRFYSEYQKTHPHMWICLGSEALLVVLLTTGGLLISESLSPRIDSVLLGRSGVTYMSTRDLAKHVQERHINAFWFGPNPSYTYSIICIQPNVKIITLYPRDSRGRPITSKKLVINTYESQTLATAIHPLTGGTVVGIDLPLVGRRIEYDNSMRTQMLVTFSGQSRVVRVHYTTPQPRQTMIDNAEVLQLIR